MGRPRASQQNIRTALAFAEIVIVRTKLAKRNNQNKVLVARKGRRSIYAAFAACFPDLARDSHDKKPMNRQGVSMVELNKALQEAGLRSVRRKNQSDDPPSSSKISKVRRI
jgi:hypothetical protein